MSVGNQIKKYRKGKMTQKELAEKIGVTPITIQNYENNRREPNIETLNKIAKVLEIPVGFLMGREDFNAFLSTKINNLSVVNVTKTNRDLFYQLKINPKHFSNVVDLKNNITIDSLKVICNELSISNEEEAFLYANYVYKTNDEVFRIVAFYYYLNDEYSIDLINPNDEYLKVGENLNKRYNLSLSLGYAIGKSNKLLVAKIIYINDSSWNILNELYDFESSYDFSLKQLNFEDKYNLISKLASTLKYELHKIAKERKDIDANFYD